MALTFTLTKNDCHDWTITKAGTGTISSIELRKYDGTLLDDELEFSVNSLAIDLSSYTGGDDGAYYVKINYSDGSNYVAYVCIYDLCDAETCYKNLFKFILCKCTDPCDEDCEDKYDLQKKRGDMEVLFGLYNEIERLTFYEKYQYYGIYTMSSARSSVFSQIGRMIDKLKVISARCGSCSDSDVLDVTC